MEIKLATDYNKKMAATTKRAVVNILKSIYSISVIKNGGLVLHASAVLRNGKAYIFFGPSGSGKTTVARLSQEFPVLDDESIFIKRRNSSYQAYGTAEAQKSIAKAQRGDMKVEGAFPIQGLYKLTQDKKVYLSRLPISQAIVELFTIPALLKGLAGHKRLLLNLSNLVTEIPCFDLHFRQDNSFWGCILSAERIAHSA